MACVLARGHTCHGRGVWARFIGFGALTFAAFGITLLVALVWGIRKFHLPTTQEAEARLDRTLPHAPLASLRDIPAMGGSTASDTLWQAHLTHMQAAARTARAPVPDMRIADKDPFALRLMAAVACVMAVGFGSAPYPPPAIRQPALIVRKVHPGKAGLSPPPIPANQVFTLMTNPLVRLRCPPAAR